jgi:hypothetical protein
VAKDIGNVTVVDKNHPSIIEINKNKKDIPNLEFKEISDEFVHKQTTRFIFEHLTHAWNIHSQGFYSNSR